MAKEATRNAYGKALAELVVERDDVLVLDADLTKSTKTIDAKKERPEHHFNMGIAEGNMMAVAAGMAASNKVVYASSFAMFAAGRAFEQIRNSICYPNLNVKVCATHAGITVGEDGASHQTVEDLSLMRSIPNMVVISPADAVETMAAIKAIANYDGPCYVRLGRAAVNVINDENTYEFKLGKGVVLSEGKDVTIIATGIMVDAAIEAKDILAKEAPNQAEVDEAIKHLTDAKNALDKYVYGTANLSYADFYYGELNDVKEDTTLDLTSDKAASYRESGMYDAVSSATTNKYKNYFSSTYSEDNTNEQGGSIIGIKDVNIAVPTSLYENAKKAISDNKECSNKLLEIISSMKLSDTTPSEYKILNGDGTLTAMKSEVIEDTSDTLTIKTQSSYGQYEVDPVTSENSPLSNLDAKKSLLGIIVEDEDGNKYGMEHLENIYGGGKFSFAVTDGFKEKHGNTIDYKRHEALQGKTIKKVTYLVKNGADIVINTNLKCKTLAGSDSIKATANDNFKDGATVSVDTAAVPSGSNYTLSSVSMGKTVLTEGTDYTYANNTLTIKATDNTGVGSYSMVFTDDTYSDIVASFTLESGYKTGDISINKNNQVTLPSGVNFKKYVNNITSIKINGVEKTGKGGIKATDLFDADGNINFNAAIKGKDGSSTPVFADKSASYTIELTSTGYPSVSGTVQLNTSILEASIKKAEALDSSKYTAETWKALQTALTEAKEAKSANTQAIVDAANTKLTEALSGLKEKAVTPSKPATPSNPDTTTTKKPATKPALKKSNVKLSKPVLKVGKTTKNKAKVTWKKVKKATGYEIQYTTKGFGNKKDTKTIKVSKAKITSTQLKKLKKKTRYKVRIRAVYTKSGYQTATSKWSAIKTVKTK